MNKQKKQQNSGKLDKKFITAMAIVIVGTSLGDVFFKKGMNLLKLPSQFSLSVIPHFLVDILSNIWIDFGVLLMVAQFIAFARALRWGPYSVVVPLRASSYIITALLAKYFLQEQLNPTRWAGILIVMFGVIMIGISDKKSS
ncbi:MAG: EamA family transporter [Scytonema sp. PMC 1069.18]|nr:EamA family transporter [Scytonema sp. PMC 1069.18]MEC4886643.1 EamA family transporter [Scytonema sp. PMC 1070.18]